MGIAVILRSAPASSFGRKVIFYSSPIIRAYPHFTISEASSVINLVGPHSIGLLRINLALASQPASYYYLGRRSGFRTPFKDTES